ncbi:hypothetical protein SEVIR_3G063601v4 [Setaria viridis]
MHASMQTVCPSQMKWANELLTDRKAQPNTKRTYNRCDTRNATRALLMTCKCWKFGLRTSTIASTIAPAAVVYLYMQGINGQWTRCPDWRWLATGAVRTVIAVYKKQPGSCRHPKTSRIERDCAYGVRLLYIYGVCSERCGHCGTKARQYTYVQRKKSRWRLLVGFELPWEYIVDLEVRTGRVLISSNQ